MINFNVCTEIVVNDMCIGCGLCVGVCPPNVLEMQFNKFGEYIPLEYKEGCLAKCDLCLRSCPFWDKNENEDALAQDIFAGIPGMLRKPETGYFLDCYVGYSKVNNQRMNGSSGGITTWLLEKLLKEGIADRVICVTENNSPDKLYKFAIFDNIEDVRRSSRSCYYPVEMGDVFREIMRTEVRYAIVGLPCSLKGIRLAMSRNRRLRRRVVALLGLVCGQTKSKFFTEYLAALKGADPSNLTHTRFRIKDPRRPASDFGLNFEWQSSAHQKQETIFWTEGMQKVWTHGFFKVNACNFCDDVFAEMADIAFMDAWLPEYAGDYRGHNLIINRSPWIKELIMRGVSDGELHLASIDVSRVVESQQGVLVEKREALQYRLALAKQTSTWAPQKRVKPEMAGKWPARRLWWLKNQVRQISREVWADGKNPDHLQKKLYWLELQIKLLEIFQGFTLVVQRGQVKEAIQRRVFYFLKRKLNLIRIHVK